MSKPKPIAKGTEYFALFKHMADNHGLVLLDSECEDIVRVVCGILARRIKPAYRVTLTEEFLDYMAGLVEKHEYFVGAYHSFAMSFRNGTPIPGIPESTPRNRMPKAFVPSAILKQLRIHAHKKRSA